MIARGGRTLLAGAVIAAFCVSERAPRSDALPGPTGSAGSGQPHRIEGMLVQMAMLAGTSASDDYIARWVKRLADGEPIDRYIDELLANKPFSRDIVPTLVFGAFANVRNYYALPSAFVLKQTSDAGTTIYYLRAPCDAQAAVTVHPWWNLASEVKVCPDSYRPEKWILTPGEHSYRSKMPLACDSQVGSPELETKSLCGCGPNLIRCLKSDEQYHAFNKSLMDEVKSTTAYVVENDLPIASLFTSTSTFRDRNAELYYRRQRIGATQDAHAEEALADLDKWPEQGQWAARPELATGQHAGLLTAPQILHSLPDRRQRQRGYYEIMWCAMRNAFGATTKQVLDLNTTGNLAFVHDSWQRLAHTPICTNCHARLDYGFQFFMGYPDSRASTYFEPALQSDKEGLLYGENIDDRRGSAPLDPAGFAKLATAQPEFDGCIARHFATYVLGDRATADDRAAILQAVGTTKFKAVMKVALERYAERWRVDSASAILEPVPWGDNPTTSARPGMVAIAPDLRKKLDDHCVECHDKNPYVDTAMAEDNVPFDFTGGELARPLVIRMADHVAFGMMPKDSPLATAERDAVVTALVAALWSARQDRDEAIAYFLGAQTGLPAHQIDNALAVIDRTAHARSPVSWGAIERALWPDQDTITPGFLALTGLEALGACKEAKRNEGGDVRDCLTRSISLKVLSRWPVDAP